jgi:hypothetical protein
VIKEVAELQIHNGDLEVIFSDNYRDLNIVSVLECLSKSCAVVDPFVMLELKVDTRDPDHIGLFFSTVPELEPSLYRKVFEALVQLSSESPLKIGTFGSGSTTGHGEEIA